MIARIVAQDEEYSKLESLFLESPDMVSDVLMKIEMPKSVRRGEEFGVTTWISIDKLKEHYYFQEAMKVVLRFCYVLKQED